MLSSFFLSALVCFFSSLPSEGISEIKSYTEYFGKIIDLAIAVYNHAVAVVMSAIGGCGIKTKLLPA